MKTCIDHNSTEFAGEQSSGAIELRRERQNHFENGLDLQYLTLKEEESEEQVSYFS